MKKAELQALLEDALVLDNRKLRHDTINSLDPGALATYAESLGYEERPCHPGDPTIMRWEHPEFGHITLWSQDKAAFVESIAMQSGVSVLQVLLEIRHVEQIPDVVKLR